MVKVIALTSVNEEFGDIDKNHEFDEALGRVRFAAAPARTESRLAKEGAIMSAAGILF